MDRIPAIRRVILADVGFAKGALGALAAVAVPTALRMAIDQGAAGIPFVTYFPAVVIATLLLGWRWGMVVAVGSAVVANWLFIDEPMRFRVSGTDALVDALFALSCVALIWVSEMARRLVRELEESKARETMLNHELMHRVKNMLATVNAMAMLTARHSEPGEFGKAFSGRMRALARATEMLGTGTQAQCEVGQLIENAVEPFRGDGNFAVGGPACQLPRDACVPLSLALHELCTNAAKHGALSRPEGRVEIAWTCDPGGLLRLDWRERDGPPVPEQRRAGMGTQLLRRQRGLRHVEVRFDPAGVNCTIEIEDAQPA